MMPFPQVERSKVSVSLHVLAKDKPVTAGASRVLS